MKMLLMLHAEIPSCCGLLAHTGCQAAASASCLHTQPPSIRRTQPDTCQPQCSGGGGVEHGVSSYSELASFSGVWVRDNCDNPPRRVTAQCSVTPPPSARVLSHVSRDINPLHCELCPHTRRLNLPETLCACAWFPDRGESFVSVCNQYLSFWT